MLKNTRTLFFPLILFLIITIACIVFFKNDTRYKYQISLTAIFQNEERFLKEWIDFHRLVGVEHFYLFNNLSTDNYLAVLNPYIDAGIVELFDWPYASIAGNEADWTRIQSSAYRMAIDLAKGNSKWLAILDTDEFLFPTQKNNLIDFLADYENVSGLLVNWQVFGTSQVKRIPHNRLMIEMLTLQSPVQATDNQYCKSIIRPEHAKYCVDPHTVVYFPWSHSVDPDKNVFPWKFHQSRQVNIEKIRINHYWTRDEDFFFERKIARNQHWGDAESRKQRCIERNQESNQLVNLDILRFAAQMK